jgi:hypothetical protein
MVLVFESDCIRISGTSHKFPTEDASFGDQSRDESSVGFERPAGYIGSIRSSNAARVSLSWQLKCTP